MNSNPASFGRLILLSDKARVWRLGLISRHTAFLPTAKGLPLQQCAQTPLPTYGFAHAIGGLLRNSVAGFEIDTVVVIL